MNEQKKQDRYSHPLKRLVMCIWNAPPIAWIFMLIPPFMYGMSPGSHWTQMVCLGIAGLFFGYKVLGA